MQQEKPPPFLEGYVGASLARPLVHPGATVTGGLIDRPYKYRIVIVGEGYHPSRILAFHLLAQETGNGLGEIPVGLGDGGAVIV